MDMKRGRRGFEVLPRIICWYFKANFWDFLKHLEKNSVMVTPFIQIKNTLQINVLLR